MERHGNQADLFEYIPSALRLDEPRLAFLERHCVTLRLDQILVLTISFIVLGAVAFGLGMESGRHLTVKAMAVSARRAEAKSEENQAARNKAVQAETEAPAAVAELPKAPVTDPKAQAENGKYTIQLVTYLTRQSAEQQIQRLKNQGLEGFVVPRGQYLLVCVNAFETRHEASRLLSELKSKGIAPSDAYIRAFPA